MFEELGQSGAKPVLAAMMRFAGARQRLLAHNIANLDTPNFIPMDVSPGGFAAELRKAVEERREGRTQRLAISSSDEVRSASGGTVLDNGPLVLHPATASGNILYHDRNNRDLERLMQALSENQLAYKTAADLLKREHDVLRIAISGRV